MIDITDDVVETVKSVIGSKVYRAYPQRLNRGERFAIVTIASRNSVTSDESGDEMVVSVTYQMTFFGKSPRDCDSILSDVTDKLNKVHLQCIGQGPSYQYDNDTYYVQATFSVTIDRRGYTYR